MTTETWEEPRLVALASPDGAMYIVNVFTPYAKPAPEMCVLAVVSASRLEGYPREAAVG